MQSKATTVAKYLAEIPPDRRSAMEAVRRVILENLDAGFEEGMQYGMIGYYVPHRLFPAGYHCDPRQPLPFAALASQKNYMSVYLMCQYGEPQQNEWFLQAWAQTGKKLNMGKSCLRFKKLDELALDVIGEAIRRVSAKAYIAHYEGLLATRRQTAEPAGSKSGKSTKKSSAKAQAKPAAKSKSRSAKSSATKSAASVSPRRKK